MWIKIGWTLIFCIAVGIQKSIGNQNPVHAALPAFALVIIISFVYFHRPSYLWGEWDPPIKQNSPEIIMLEEIEERGHLEIHDNENNNEQYKNLLSYETRTGDNISSDEISVGDIQLSNIPNPRPELPTEKCRRPTERIHFLNNVKIFLTIMVVSFHVAGAFGGLGRSWTLVIGLYKKDNMLKIFLDGLNMINQSYFMSLFFFIAGFFTPSNYERKGGEQFVKDRTRRLLIPALATTFLLVPLTTMIAQWTASFKLMYVPYTEHSWFIYWLLLFEWVYVTIRKEGMSLNQTSRPISFPSTPIRLGLGLLFCGLATYYFAIEAKIKTFWSMPTFVPGSIFCDILLFFAGTVAKKSGWISPSSTIAEQLDLPLIAFRLLVITEATLVFMLRVSWITSTGSTILYYMVAGVFCIDMSIFVLQSFQQYASKPAPAFFSDSAFTVYLIHPLVITVCTSVFVKIYNALYDNVIEFDDKLGIFLPVSRSHLMGPMDGVVHLFVGFLVVLVTSNAIVWPIAWHLRKLPIVNQYL